MKRVFSLFFLFISFFLVGCEKEKFYLDDKYYGESLLQEIDNSKLKELEKSKGSFCVYVYLSGCSTCNQFRGVLNQFLDVNKLKFYSISILEIDNTKIDKVVKYAPSLVIYKDGKIVSYLDSVSDEHIGYFTSLDEFGNWFSNYVYLEK